MSFLGFTYAGFFWLLIIPILLYIIGKLMLKKVYVPYIYKIDKYNKKYIGLKISDFLDLLADLLIVLFSLFYINNFVVLYDIGKPCNIRIVDTSPSVSFPYYRLDTLKNIVLKDSKNNDIIITTDCVYNNIKTSPYFSPNLSLHMAESYPIKNGNYRNITLYSDYSWYNGYVSYKYVLPSWKGYIIPQIKNNKLELKGAGNFIMKINSVIVLDRYVSKDTLIYIPNEDSVIVEFNGDRLYIVSDFNVHFLYQNNDYVELIEKIMESMGFNIKKTKGKNFCINDFYIKCDTADDMDYIVEGGREIPVYKVHYTIPKGNVTMWSKSGYPLVECVDDTIFFHFSISPKYGGFVITPYYMKLWYNILSTIMNKGRRVLFIIDGKKVDIREHPPFNNTVISNNDGKYLYSNYRKPFILYILLIIIVGIVKYRLFI